MNNDSIMEFLLKYDNLKGLSYSDGILTYQGKSINISNVPLVDFYTNQYSQMYLDQKTISSEDFFIILSIHATKIESIEYKRDDKYDIINLNHYFSLISSEKLKDNDKLLVANFEGYIASLIEYQDYLLKSKKEILNEYTQRIVYFSYLRSDDKNEVFKLTNEEKRAIDKYYEIADYVRNKNNELVRKKTKNDDVSSGYINAFIVILTLIASGIGIALTMFFIINAK